MVHWYIYAARVYILHIVHKPLKNVQWIEWQMASLLACGNWALVSAFRHVRLITNFAAKIAAKITCAEMLLSQQSPLPSLPRLTHDGLIATIDILVSCSDLSKNTRRCLSVKIE